MAVASSNKQAGVSRPLPLVTVVLLVASHDALTATIPFDDRQCQRADRGDLRLPLIQAYLRDVGSDLHVDDGKMPLLHLCPQMNLLDGTDEHVKPRNVGILFLNDEPTKFLPGS